MFIAHLGVGLAAKSVAPRASLGVLLLAGQTLDVLCGLLMVTGVERMRVVPGITRMTPLDLYYYPFSHGLLMSLVWAVLFALVGLRLYRDRRIAVVLGLLVFSHWVLDWISHRPDLPLLFDGSPKVGLGLWNSVAGTLVVELGVFLGGLALYVRSTRARDRVGTGALVALALFFAGLFLANHFGPPPPTTVPQQLLALPILLMALLLPWGHWIDRHRVAAGADAAAPRPA
jgi:uncharacterized membrane protein